MADKNATNDKTPLLGSAEKQRTVSATSYGSVFSQNKDDEPKEDACRTQISRRDVILIGSILLVACVTIVITLVVGLPKIQQKKLQYFDTTPPVSSSPLVTFPKALVITDAEPCAPIGRNILEQGGSAVDSAIAMLFCGGVVNPQSMGLGGGFFMTIYNRATNTSVVIDGRETAPANATAEMFNGNESLSTVGGLASAVPGELRGYWLAHQKYGLLNWSSLVAPSIRLCRLGFQVSKHLADRLQELKKEIMEESSMRELFYNNETGNVYKEGETLKRPALAKTLEKISVQGADVLYDGELTANFVSDIQEFGGIISVDDMKKYEAKIRPSISFTLANKTTMYSVPPPGSGAVLAFILNVLEGYNITKEGIENPHDTLLMYHHFVEAFKFAFAHRTKMGDEDFVNVTGLIETMVSSHYGDSIRKKISDTETFPENMYGADTFGPEDHGTAQVSVVAPNGDAVSATSSLNTQFGSMRRSRSTGIILNSNMDDFSSPNITNYFGLPPSSSNLISPEKRAMSSMCPAIFVDGHGDVSIVLGGAGGSRIITATSLVASSVLWLNKTIKEAVDAPRIHHQLHPNAIQHEKEFPRIYLDGLSTIYGHQFLPDSERSVILGIVRNKNGQLTANVDHRKGGAVEGF